MTCISTPALISKKEKERNREKRGKNIEKREKPREKRKKDRENERKERYAQEIIGRNARNYRYIGRNAQNTKKVAAADQQQHTVIIRAPVGANMRAPVEPKFVFEID